ncbi:MAG: hypothetical protein AB7V40_06745 [Methyloceanibacter sp.]
MRIVSSVALARIAAALMLLVSAGCSVRPSNLGASWLGGESDTSTASIRASNESTSAVPAPSRLSVATAKPVDAYVLLGGRIKTCWFNADRPLLPRYVYRADVSPSGRMVQIVIHEKLALGRAGNATYAVDFKEEGAYTVVRTYNRTMPPVLAAKMQYDIDRWKRGETNCNTVMPKVAAAAPAAQ